MALDIDESGIVKSGRFQGHHISNVADYAESLEETIKTSASPPSAPVANPQPPVARPAPEQVLQQQAAPRVSQVEMLTAQRLEADDEAQFAAMVSDYLTPLPNTDPPITMRQAVWKLKEALPMSNRLQKGIHAQLYAMVKQQVDQKVQAAIFGNGKVATSPVDEDEEHDQEGEAPETMQAPASAPAAPASSPVPPVRATPKAVSPVASPTPSRAPAQKVRAPKLVASERLIKFIKATGNTDVNAYLLRLEAQGMTQADLDRAYDTPRGQGPERRRTVYDRA